MIRQSVLDPHYAHQQHYYDEACDPEFEIRRPRGCGRVVKRFAGGGRPCAALGPRVTAGTAKGLCALPPISV